MILELSIVDLIKMVMIIVTDVCLVIGILRWGKRG